jgi:hypothetical protein
MIVEIAISLSCRLHYYPNTTMNDRSAVILVNRPQASPSITDVLLYRLYRVPSSASDHASNNNIQGFVVPVELIREH